MIALNVLQGIVNAWDVPARQAFTVEMIEDRDDLSNAIALSSSTVHAARLVGPAVGGYLIYAVGEGYCFLIDGFSFLAVIGALLAMRLKPPRRSLGRPGAPGPRCAKGSRYAFGFAPIRTLLTMVAVTSLTSMSQSTLMPIFAANMLGGGERTLGWLLGATGVGALAGSLYLASRRTRAGAGTRDRGGLRLAGGGDDRLRLVAAGCRSRCRYWRWSALRWSCRWPPATRCCKRSSTTTSAAA